MIATQPLKRGGSQEGLLGPVMGRSLVLASSWGPMRPMSGYVRHIARENYISKEFLKTKNVRVGSADCRCSRIADKPRWGQPTADAVG